MVIVIVIRQGNDNTSSTAANHMNASNDNTNHNTTNDNKHIN